MLQYFRVSGVPDGTDIISSDPNVYSVTSEALPAHIISDLLKSLFYVKCIWRISRFVDCSVWVGTELWSKTGPSFKACGIKTSESVKGKLRQMESLPHYTRDSSSPKHALETFSGVHCV